MSLHILSGCPLQPLASYLKALGLFRLVSEQLNRKTTRGAWGADCFLLECELDRESLIKFFLQDYRPSSVIAPWNGGSGFYLKDRKVGMSAILNSSDARFAPYAEDLKRAISIVAKAGGDKGANKRDEDRRREVILKECRNQLSDVCVDWLDAAISISAEDKRSFAPILGTGGNEGRLDYTNNFMENVSALLSPKSKLPGRSLLENALFGTQTGGFQDLAIGQYDPGRSGGFNQGNGVESKTLVNPWNAVLMIEGAIAWAGGIYRKQGVSFKSILCSPFTVRPSAVGFGSASSKDEATARAEIWTPLWKQQALYAEIRSLLREGRSSVSGKPAATGLQFAEAAASLGVDRAISGFVRYSMLKRRGDSYIAMPAGQFPVMYQSTSDNVREAQSFLEAVKRAVFNKGLETANSWPPLVRSLQETMFQALLHGERETSLINLAKAIGQMYRRLLSSGVTLKRGILSSASWVSTCERMTAEGRIAAALASFVDRTRNFDDLLVQTLSNRQYWLSRDPLERMLSTLERRTREEQGHDTRRYLQQRSVCLADIEQFISGQLDDDLVEILVCTFALAKISRKASGTDPINAAGDCRRYPAYCLLKQLFSTTNQLAQEEPRLHPDASALSLLRAGRAGDATDIAIKRLKIAGLKPLVTKGFDIPESSRVAAALLIPVAAHDMRKLRTFVTQPHTEGQNND